MLRRTIILCSTFILISVIASSPVHSQSRTTSRNDFGIELLGKAVLFSFNYQYMATQMIGLEAGLGAIGGSATYATVVFVPVGARLYFVPKDGSPFITGGFVYLTGRTDSGPIDSKTYSYGGLGFEYRSTSGFLFRGTAYGLIAGGEFFIWPGLNVGYAF